MGKRFLEAGKIVGTHGLKGEVRAQSWCDSNEVLAGFGSLYLDGEGRQKLKVVSARVHKNSVIFKFSGIDYIDEAEKLKGRVLFIDRKDLALPEGTYFIQDLIGLEVLDADTGKVYGTLADVSPTGANDVYHVKGGDGRVYLLPAVREMVVSVEIDAGCMKVRPVKGIFEDED